MFLTKYFLFVCVMEWLSSATEQKKYAHANRQENFIYMSSVRIMKLTFLICNIIIKRVWKTFHNNYESDLYK